MSPAYCYPSTIKVSTAATRADDVREMIAAVCEHLDLPPYIVAHRVVMTWRPGITINDWLAAAAPPEQRIAKVWL